MQDGTTLTIILQSMWVMAYHQQGTGCSSMLKRIFTTLTEAIVTSGRNFVNQVAIEING